MPDTAQHLQAVSPLSGYQQSINGTLVREVSNLFIIAISVPDQGRDSLNALLQTHWQLSLPETGSCKRASDIMFAGSTTGLALLGMQADQCLLVCEENSAGEQNEFDHVHELLGNSAYLTDQSDSFAVLDIAGSHALSAMERVCTLDLETFTNTQVARTLMEHLSVIVERPTSDGLRLYSPRSSAMSFLHAITTSLALSQ